MPENEDGLEPRGRGLGGVSTLCSSLFTVSLECLRVADGPHLATHWMGSERDGTVRLDSLSTSSSAASCCPTTLWGAGDNLVLLWALLPCEPAHWA